MHRKTRVSFLEDYSEEEQAEVGSSSRNNYQTILNDENASCTSAPIPPKSRRIGLILRSLDNLLLSSPSETSWSRNRLRSQEIEERKMTWEQKGRAKEVDIPSADSSMPTDKSISLEKSRKMIGERLYQDVQNSGVNLNSTGSSSRSPFNLSTNSNSKSYHPIQSTPFINPFNSARPSAPFDLPSTSSTSKSAVLVSSSSLSDHSITPIMLRSNAPSPESKLSSPTQTEPRIFFRRPSLVSRVTVPPSPPTSPSPAPVPTPTPLFSPSQSLNNELSATHSSTMTRFSTFGLPPIKHYLLRHSGFIQILAEGCDLVINLSLRNSNQTVEIIRISADGNTISTKTRITEDSDLVTRIYDRDSLPLHLEKYYSLASKFVKAVRGKVKKMIIFTRHPFPIRKQIIYSDDPPSFELTFYSTSSTSSFDSPNFSIRVSRISNHIHITRFPPSSITSRKLCFPLDNYLSNPLSITSVTRDERTQLDWSLAQINSIDSIVRNLDALPLAERLILVDEKSLGNTRNNNREEKKQGTNTKEELLELLRRVEHDSDNIAIKVNENVVEFQKEERRYLKGAGWIVRTRPSSSSSSSCTSTWYRILLADGTEFEIGESDKVVRWKGKWYSLVHCCELGTGRRGKKLPVRVRRVMGIVGEMIELF